MLPITGSVEGISKDMGWSDVSVGGCFLLFTGDFAIKARERDGKGLHGTQRVVEVQCENVVSYPSKLHHNVVHWKRQETFSMR